MILKKKVLPFTNHIGVDTWFFGYESQHKLVLADIEWSGQYICDENGVESDYDPKNATHVNFTGVFENMIGTGGNHERVSLYFPSEEDLAKFMMTYQDELVLR